MKSYFIFTVITFFSFSINAQQDTVPPVVDEYSEAVKQCLKSNGTYEYYANVVDQMFMGLQQQYQSKGVPDAVWTEVKGIKMETLDELSQMFVSAYKGLFTLKDVKKLNTLYATKAGKKMIKQEALDEGDTIVITEFYKSETGQKVTGSQNEINTAMSKITEIWSKDLYKSVLSKLNEKGF